MIGMIHIAIWYTVAILSDYMVTESTNLDFYYQIKGCYNTGFSIIEQKRYLDLCRVISASFDRT